MRLCFFTHFDGEAGERQGWKGEQGRLHGVACTQSAQVTKVFLWFQH